MIPQILIGSPLTSIKLVENSFCCTYKTVWRDEERRRSWKERLFSLPWKPLQATKIVSVPHQEIDKYHILHDKINGVYYVHPHQMDQVKKALGAL